MSGRVGVAISTTGHEHRMGFLETCVRHWSDHLPTGGSLFVTVDGSDEDTRRVAQVVGEWTGSVYRVGQPRAMFGQMRPEVIEWLDGPKRLGVAANKNTGLELLMDNTKVEHLFLSDDDTWPLLPQSLNKHTDMTFRGIAIPHSLVMWGNSRLSAQAKHHAQWTWPRGAMMYTHRTVVERVGGMDERMVNAHEHAEWSTRIHNAGLTPAPFVSPLVYALRGEAGAAMRAAALWHAEDMRRPHEDMGIHDARRKAITSIDRAERDWDLIHSVMGEREGSSEFVDYHAHSNGRASATLYPNKPSRGADE